MGICKGPMGDMVRFDKSAPTWGGRRCTVGLGGLAVYSSGILTCLFPGAPAGTLASRRRGGDEFLLPQGFE